MNLQPQIHKKTKNNESTHKTHSSTHKLCTLKVVYLLRFNWGGGDTTSSVHLKFITRLKHSWGICSVLARIVGKFHTSEQTSTKQPSVPSWVKIRTIPVCFGHSGPFRQIPASIQVFGRYEYIRLKLKKKTHLSSTTVGVLHGSI